MLSLDFEAELAIATATPLLPTDLSDCAAVLLERHIGINVPGQALHDAFLPAWNLGLPLRPASVPLLLMSATVMEPLVGTSLHAALRKRVLSAAARVPEPAPAKPLEDELKAEVVRLLAAKRATAPDEPTALQYTSPVKRQRTEAAIAEFMGDKTEMVRVALANNMPLKFQVTTLQDVAQLAAKLARRDPDTMAQEEA